MIFLLQSLLIGVFSFTGTVLAIIWLLSVINILTTNPDKFPKESIGRNLWIILIIFIPISTIYYYLKIKPKVTK